MQRDQILAMEPGRELDTAIALHIMGYEKSRMQSGFVRKGNCAALPKPYSTDIAAAWEVAEKMHADGRYNLALEWYTQEKEWGADFDEWGVTSQCCAKTAPLAICRAALLAVIEEVPNET